MNKNAPGVLPPVEPTLTDDEIRERLEWAEGADLKALIDDLRDTAPVLYRQVGALLTKLSFRQCECGWETPGSFDPGRVERKLSEHLADHPPLRTMQIAWPPKSER